jgi:hypothetical protein
MIFQQELIQTDMLEQCRNNKKRSPFNPAREQSGGRVTRLFYLRAVLDKHTYDVKTSKLHSVPEDIVVGRIRVCASIQKQLHDLFIAAFDCLSEGIPGLSRLPSSTMEAIASTVQGVFLFLQDGARRKQMCYDIDSLRMPARYFVQYIVEIVWV